MNKGINSIWEFAQKHHKVQVMYGGGKDAPNLKLRCLSPFDRSSATPSCYVLRLNAENDSRYNLHCYKISLDFL